MGYICLARTQKPDPPLFRHTWLTSTVVFMEMRNRIQEILDYSKDNSVSTEVTSFMILLQLNDEIGINKIPQEFENPKVNRELYKTRLLTQAYNHLMTIKGVV